MGRQVPWATGTIGIPVPWAHQYHGLIGTLGIPVPWADRYHWNTGTMGMVSVAIYFDDAAGWASSGVVAHRQ